MSIQKFLWLIIISLNIGCAAAQKSATSSAAVNPSYYPPFSWDKVPVMAHFGKAEGLTNDEINFLVKHFSWIVLEKGHAAKTSGSTESGISDDAQRIKKINPACKVLYYWNSSINFSGMYESVKEFDNHPEWAVKDKNGNLVLAHANKRKRYDHSNPELRKWWVKSVAEEVNKSWMDGVFIDALPQISMHRKANIDLLGQDKQDAQETGVMESLKLLREQTPGKILLYNGLRGKKDLWADMGVRYFAHTDAAMVEHFTSISATDKETIAGNIEVIQQEGKKGKIVVVKGFPDFNWTDTVMMKRPYSELEKLAKEQLLFSLAAYLIAAGENSYFCYSWGYRENHGTFSWYPEFDKPLGKPKGDAVKNGWSYTREFEHCKVKINIENKTASIDWQ